MTRERRLEKKVDYANSTVSIKVIATGQEITCNANDLPADIQAKLVPLALSHRLGDAAAGLDGQEAYDAISKVWEGLKTGNFTIRTAAAPKGVQLSDIASKLAGLTGKDAQLAAALLEKLGIKLPVAAPAA